MINDPNISDTTKRYLGTEHYGSVEILPDAINIKGGSSSPLSIKFEDGVGVTLTSPKKLTMSASGEIIMKTPKSIKLNAQSQIAMVKTNAASGLAMEGDLNYKSNNVILDGTVKEAFDDFDDDEPKEGKKPDPPMPTWEKVAIGVAVAAAVVGTIALVCVAAPVIAEAVLGTAFRIGLAVAKNALIGATVCGVSDFIIQGVKNKGDLSKFDRKEFISAISVGAYSGALATFPLRVGWQIAGNATFGFAQSVTQGQTIDNMLSCTLAAKKRWR